MSNSPQARLPASPPIGPCRKCTFFHDESLCRRWPESVPTTADNTCGEWRVNTRFTDDDVRAAVPEQHLEANPWLLDKVPHPFPREYFYKQAWSYGAHMLAFFQDLELFGGWHAVKQCTPFYVTSRAVMTNKIFRPINDADEFMVGACDFMIENIGALFPDHACKGLIEELVEKGFVVGTCSVADE